MISPFEVDGQCPLRIRAACGGADEVGVLGQGGRSRNDRSKNTQPKRRNQLSDKDSRAHKSVFLSVGPVHTKQANFPNYGRDDQRRRPPLDRDRTSRVGTNCPFQTGHNLAKTPLGKSRSPLHPKGPKVSGEWDEPPQILTGTRAVRRTRPRSPFQAEALPPLAAEPQDRSLNPQERSQTLHPGSASAGDDCQAQTEWHRLAPTGPFATSANRTKRIEIRVLAD